MTAFTCASARTAWPGSKPSVEQKQRRFSGASSPRPVPSCSGSSLRPHSSSHQPPPTAAGGDNAIVHLVRVEMCVGVFAGMAAAHVCVCVCVGAWCLLFPPQPRCLSSGPRPAAHRLSVLGFTVWRPRLLQHVGG